MFKLQILTQADSHNLRKKIVVNDKKHKKNGFYKNFIQNEIIFFFIQCEHFEVKHQ